MMKTSISITKVKNNINETLNELLMTDTDYIHIDMMDGKFVEQVQQLPSEVIPLCKDINKLLDVHMMVDDPFPLIREMSVLNNINNITIHYEIGNTESYIDCIHELGYKAGIAINPNTIVNDIKQYLDNVDMVLIMGVYPGLGGQKLIDETVNKIKELVDLRNQYGFKYEIEFDGGVNEETRKLLDGLDIIVSGSYVCLADNMQDAINKLR